MKASRARLLDRLREGPLATARVTYRRDGPTIEEWAKSVGGQFAKVLKKELRREPNTGELCVWSLMRTADAWEKWAPVNADVVYTLSEFNDMVREFQQCEKKESKRAPSESAARNADCFFRRVIGPSGI